VICRFQRLPFFSKCTCHAATTIQFFIKQEICRSLSDDLQILGKVIAYYGLMFKTSCDLNGFLRESFGVIVRNRFQSHVLSANPGCSKMPMPLKKRRAKVKC